MDGTVQRQQSYTASTLTWVHAAPRDKPFWLCPQRSLSPIAHDSATPAELITPGLRPGGCCPSGWAPAAPFARLPSHFGGGRFIKTSLSLPAASDGSLVVASVLGGSPSLHNSPPAASKGGHWELALSVLNECELRSTPNIISYNAAMSACGRGRCWELTL